MSQPTIQQIIDGMPSRFDPVAANGLAAVLQFRLTGGGAVDFYAIIGGERCETHRGLHEKPTLTLRMSTSTYIDMVMGKLTGQEAFFKRKLRYEGPISLAVKLHRLFRSPEWNN
ncbi:MAG: SCP2 sterol-binding domain-containing protein [Pseudomonadota bacterium]